MLDVSSSLCKDLEKTFEFDFSCTFRVQKSQFSVISLPRTTSKVFLQALLSPPALTQYKSFECRYIGLNIKYHYSDSQLARIPTAH